MNGYRTGKLKDIAKLYNADITILHNTAAIHYHKLGYGCGIADKIQDLLGTDIDYTIKMTPSDQTVTLEVYDEQS